MQNGRRHKLAPQNVPMDSRVAVCPLVIARAAPSAPRQMSGLASPMKRASLVSTGHVVGICMPGYEATGNAERRLPASSIYPNSGGRNN